MNAADPASCLRAALEAVERGQLEAAGSLCGRAVDLAVDAARTATSEQVRSDEDLIVLALRVRREITDLRTACLVARRTLGGRHGR